MKQLILFTLIVVLTMGCDPKTITDAIGGGGQLTEKEVAKGLKEALTKGVVKGASDLAKENGYLDSPYKILLPEEARKIVDKLKVVPGFKNIENELVLRMNRAAEKAATSARPIFTDAIRKMTIRDAWNILKGEDDAATRYLESTTYSPLYDSFQPEILSALNEVNAVDYWEKAVNKYNSLPFVEDMNPRLDDHVTQKALNGLFSKIEIEEGKIRKEPVARTSDLLKRVFAKQDE